MQFTLFATLAALVAVAVALPQWGGGDLPENEDQNNNVNQNDNQIDNELFSFHSFDNFRAIDNVVDNFCHFNERTGDLTFLGKRSDLMKRQFDGDGFGDGFGFRRVMPVGFPGFENLDFNNNQNANVNQNANLASNFLQSFNFDRVHDGFGGDFVHGFSSGSIGALMDCFFDDDGILVAGRR